MDDDEHLVKFLLESLARPEQELLPLFLPGDDNVANDKKHSDKCQSLVCSSGTFPSIVSECIQRIVIVVVITEWIGCPRYHYDAETLWGQAELQNEALQSLVKRNIKKMVKTIESQGPEQVRLLDMGDILSENDESDDSK